MTRSARHLVRLFVGLSALVLTGMGGAAFASVGPPDPAGYSGPSTPFVQTVTTGLTFWSVLLIAIVAVAVGALSVEIVHMVRRHRTTYGAVTA